MGRARPTETPPVLWTFCLPPPSAAGLLLFVAAFLTPAEFATSPVILPLLPTTPFSRAWVKRVHVPLPACWEEQETTF